MAGQKGTSNAASVPPQTLSAAPQATASSGLSCQVERGGK